MEISKQGDTCLRQFLGAFDEGLLQAHTKVDVLPPWFLLSRMLFF